MDYKTDTIHPEEQHLSLHQFSNGHFCQFSFRSLSGLKNWVLRGRCVSFMEIIKKIYLKQINK